MALFRRQLTGQNRRVMKIRVDLMMTLSLVTTPDMSLRMTPIMTPYLTARRIMKPEERS